LTRKENAATRRAPSRLLDLTRSAGIKLKLLNSNWLSDDRVALVDRLDCDANDLIGLPTSRRDQQVGHHCKAGPPDHRHPKDHSFHRAHARPRHDRLIKYALIRPIAKRKLFVQRSGALIDWQK
jgi:hypothetical protein